MRISRYDTNINRPMGRLEKYFRNIQQDLKLFGFVLLLLCLYRVIFMGMLANFMGSDTGISDILQANWTGLRLSLKSAGGFALLSFARYLKSALLVGPAPAYNRHGGFAFAGNVV